MGGVWVNGVWVSGVWVSGVRVSGVWVYGGPGWGERGLLPNRAGWHQTSRINRLLVAIFVQVVIRAPRARNGDGNQLYEREDCTDESVDGKLQGVPVQGRDGWMCGEVGRVVEARVGTGVQVCFALCDEVECVEAGWTEGRSLHGNVDERVVGDELHRFL